MDKNIIKNEVVDRKTITYSKGNMNCSFTFRTDIKQEMKDLIEILETAKKDIELLIKSK